MINRRLFLILLLILTSLLGFSSCKSKTVVKKLTNQNTTNQLKKWETDKIDGVMYHLPQTIVQATIPVNKVTQSPGSFVKFAPCFFSKAESDNAIKDKKTEFSINPPIFSTRGVPDTSKTYVIQTKGRYFESKTLFVEYSPGTYILQKGEAESKNETLDFTLKAISTVAGVAAKVAPLLQATNLSNKDKEEVASKLREEYRCYEIIGGTAAAPKIAEAFNAKTDIETYLKSLNNPAIQPPIIDQTDAKQKFRDEYQKALAVFEKLQEIQRQRDDILNGGNNNNIPSETLKLMLEKNAESIAAYRAAFLGRESEKVWSATFEFTPNQLTPQQNSPLVFSYSETTGVCRNGLIKEKSIPISSGFENKKCGDSDDSTTQVLWLKVTKSTDVNQTNFLTQIQNANNLAESKDKSRGWYYRVPADGIVTLQNAQIPCRQIAAGGANYNCSPISIDILGGNIKIQQTFANEITVVLNDEQLGLGNLQIAQLGVVASVPASTAGRSSTTAITLDPATGAMKNFKSSSTALIDKSLLDEAGKAANSAIDAADPLNKKKRELEEKKIQNQINDEDKKLSNSSDTDN